MSILNDLYQELNRANFKTQDLLLKMVLHFSNIEHFEQKVEESLQVLGKQLKVDRIFIVSEDNERSQSLPTFEWCDNDISPEVKNLPRIFQEEYCQSLKKMIDKKGLICTSDINRLPKDVFYTLAPLQLQSVFLAPLQVLSKFYGYFVLETHTQPRTWKKEEVNFLRIYTILLSTVLERKILIDNKEESDSKFQHIFTHAGDALFVVDYNLNFIAANQKAIQNFGYSQQELLNMKASRIILNKYIDAFEKYTTQLSALKQVVYDYAVSKSGKIIPSEIVSKAIDYNGQKAILLIVRDIADRQQVEGQILRAVFEAEERERKRVAKDIHDGLGPLLSTVKLYVNELQSEDIGDNEKNELLTYTNELIDDAISSAKTISNNLMPTIIRDYGVISAIESFCKKLNITETINIQFEHNVTLERFESTLEIVLYRIVKELINNTVKHASARNINIKITQSGMLLLVDYKDDGVGFNVQETLNNDTSGMGLNNILNRTKSLNGECSISSELGNGTTVHLEFHLNT